MFILINVHQFGTDSNKQYLLFNNNSLQLNQAVSTNYSQIPESESRTVNDTSEPNDVSNFVNFKIACNLKHNVFF